MLVFSENFSIASISLVSVRRAQHAASQRAGQLLQGLCLLELSFELSFEGMLPSSTNGKAECSRSTDARIKSYQQRRKRLAAVYERFMQLFVSLQKAPQHLNPIEASRHKHTQVQSRRHLAGSDRASAKLASKSFSANPHMATSVEDLAFCNPGAGKRLLGCSWNGGIAHLEPPPCCSLDLYA